MSQLPKFAVIIPARYGSTRFPGKPLKMLGDKPVLQHVWDTVQEAVTDIPHAEAYVATDDDRIADYATESGMDVIMTSSDCLTGSDRVLEAASSLVDKPDVVINMQGDVPLMPSFILSRMIETFANDLTIEVATPALKLSWDDLDVLRENKSKTPFSGTTVVTDHNHNALWFSKMILPAMRKEAAMRDAGEDCPVLRHIGLYAYKYDVLQKFNAMPEGIYEKLEGLEQLRFLENNVKIKVVSLSADGELVYNGIDTPEDLENAERLLQQKR